MNPFHNYLACCWNAALLTTFPRLATTNLMYGCPTWPVNSHGTSYWTQALPLADFLLSPNQEGTCRPQGLCTSADLPDDPPVPISTSSLTRDNVVSNLTGCNGVVHPYLVREPLLRSCQRSKSMEL